MKLFAEYFYRLCLFLLFFFITHVSFSQNKQARNHLVYVDKQGVLRWTNNKSEASFFGVNYTVPFAYGYRSIKALNKDVKKAIDQDVYHMARIGVDAFRVHVWDTEITDSLGNLLDNEHVDFFDYLIAQLKKRGIKILVTPIAFWGNGYPEKDELTPGFSRVYGKGQAVVNEAAIKAQERYLSQFFRHVNRYTQLSYGDDPDIIAAEINNEPHHSGPKEKTTEYVNRLANAIRSTGWTKPVFYNISESPSYADAIATASVDGHSFQWYPTGLVAGHEVKGNFLPHVDKYVIPFDTIAAFRTRAKMVYEFDAADLLQSCMYPAIARSFKTAGFQWATQFAYDPMATAYGNTEYQTHYLNLVYTPSKAISLLIASKAFHKLPRLKSFGTYPADSAFDVFRVSYRNDLSEMNAETEFYYSNTTQSVPVHANKLQHIAGVGSSSLVHYDGYGAYFLDKLEEGVWRLEVMPDALHIHDPFEKASPKKEVTRIQWQQQPMQILLPDLGNAFSIKPLNKGNSYSATAMNNRFFVQPGSYLVVTKGKERNNWTANSKTGVVQLGEFVAPPSFDSSPYLVYHQVPAVSAGKPFDLHIQVVGVDSSDKILLQLNGGRQVQRISFTRQTAYDYTAHLPAEVLIPGILNYRILLQKGNDYYTYPGDYKGNPYAWDYYYNDTYSLTVAPENGGLSLFDATVDRSPWVYPTYRRGLENKWVTTEQPGQMALRIAVTELSGDHTLGFQSYFGDKLEGRPSELSTFRTLVVRARTSSVQPVKAKITLITKEAVSYSAMIILTAAFQDVEIPINSFQKDAMLLLPRPYPGFMPLWFTASGQQTLSLADAEKVQLTIGSDVLPAEWNQPFSIETVSVWLKK